MKFLVSSANGYGNVGDDICGYSAKYLAQKVCPGSKVFITSPPFNEHLAKVSDVVILGGGGIIYDRSEPNVENFMIYLDHAQKHNKPSIVLGVGVQGIVTESGKKRYKEILNKADLVTVRSETDKEQLEDIGVKNVIATQDLGFLADEWVRTPLLKPRLNKTSKPRLGIGLLDVRHLIAYKKGNIKLRAYIEIVENNIERLSKEFDIHLFAHSNDDENWRKQLAEKYKLRHIEYRHIKDFNKFFYMYKQMDLVLGIRFHSVILGILARKPIVAIGSEGAKQFKLANSVPILKKQIYSMGNSSKLDELFSKLYEMYEAKSFKRLPEKDIIKLKSDAQKNARLLQSAVDRYRDDNS